MLKGGVIMDVVTPEQARIAQDAGAVAVMALERVPADIRAQGGVARMSDPDLITGIIEAVSIPVMAKARIGHFVEAQVLQSLGVDYIDESEVLTPADYAHHIDKQSFTVPFVCGATNLGEALRRITEGAAMIRSKGEAGTGDVSNAVTHMRTIRDEIRRLTSLPEDELYVAAKELAAPYELVAEVARTGHLPVVLFTAGGIATPADAAMMMQMGAEGVFVGSGIFKSGDPAKRAAAIVRATAQFDDPDVIAEVSRGLGEAMVGINVDEIPEPTAWRNAAGDRLPGRWTSPGAGPRGLGPAPRRRRVEPGGGRPALQDGRPGSGRDPGQRGAAAGGGTTPRTRITGGSSPREEDSTAMRTLAPGPCVSWSRSPGSRSPRRTWRGPSLTARRSSASPRSRAARTRSSSSCTCRPGARSGRTDGRAWSATSSTPSRGGVRRSCRPPSSGGQEIYPVRLPEILAELASGWNGRCLDLTDPVDHEVLAELSSNPPRHCDPST